MDTNKHQTRSTSQTEKKMDISFLSEYIFGSTNINDEQKAFLKERVEKVTEEALAIQPFRCIRELRFVIPRICIHPQFHIIKERITKSPHLKIADVGCAFGTDVRKLILDGATDVYAIDQYRQFWDLGSKLFGDESERKSILDKCFVEGNILEPQFIEKFTAEHGHLNIIYLGSVLHLFEQDEVVKVLSNMKMMFPSNTSETRILFGRTVGAPTPTIAESSSFRKQDNSSPSTSQTDCTSTGLRYLHSKESLRELLECLGFQNIQTSWVQRPVDAKYGIVSFYATL